MDNLNEASTVNTAIAEESQSSEFVETNYGNKNDEIISENVENFSKISLEAEIKSFTEEIKVEEIFNKPLEEAPNEPLQEPSDELLKETMFKKDEDLGVSAIGELLELPKVPEELNYCNEIEEKLNDKQSLEVEVDSVSETLSEKIAELYNLPKSENTAKVILNPCEDKENSSNHVGKKLINVSDTFTDSSQSLGSELQSSAAPFESSCSSQENIIANRINFENAIESQTLWKGPSVSHSPPAMDLKMEVELTEPIKEPLKQQETIPATSEIPVITLDENSQPPIPAKVNSTTVNDTLFSDTELQPPPPPDQPVNNETVSEIKVEEIKQELPPQPIPLPPAPRKRGRPRKQVLPTPNPVVEFCGSNTQNMSGGETQKKEGKRSARAERRQSKKKKFEDGEGQDENSSRRRRNSQATPKKKRRSTYVPKRKLQAPKKKLSEMENFQNFEEETRMSASEGPTGFSSRSGATGDESQGSSATTDGPTRSNTNKKGRMEVGSDGCKPVTVQQIVEYYWPPPSSLPHGEKPEGLMIQEQITEYLGVKSFKRKYPSIKRRPVDMEERNYLQENGYVSENMCDMGLTAVFAADIIEIMYNDFPQKFDEYRKYTREKKAKEQRALREKQAAERADMDPQKEAVESTYSWNSEFNKTRRFRVVHRDPDMRTFTDGVPCPTFERLVLLHAPNNSAVCVEDDFWKMTLFSYECEISSHTRLDRARQFMNQNIWMFLVGTLRI